jgi:hypothetical protein
MVFGSLLFIADKMRDLSLSEPKSREITGWDTGRFPPTLVRVGLACEAWLGHESSKSGESKSDPLGDNVDHHKICCLDTTDPIYKPSSESDSEGGQEVFMVGQGELKWRLLEWPKQKSPEWSAGSWSRQSGQKKTPRSARWLRGGGGLSEDKT